MKKRINNFQQFESVKWYSKGKLVLDPETDLKIPSFAVGDRVILIDNKDCYWDDDHFRDSLKKPGNLMTVYSEDLKEIQGHLCVRCLNSGWYKVDCVEKSVKESIRWYTSGALLPPEDDPYFDGFNIGDTVYMINPNGAIYNDGGFKNSRCDIHRNMGVVKQIEEKGGYMCFKTNLVSDWYKVTCATKEKPS